MLEQNFCILFDNIYENLSIVATKVILGEQNVETVRDCPNCPEVQVIDVDDVIVHQKFVLKRFLNGYDIALVRLKTLAVLFFVSFLNLQKKLNVFYSQGRCY